jgi:hypothetical protein
MIGEEHLIRMMIDEEDRRRNEMIFDN